ncbi:MAG: polysaccharide biosynthesis protein [Bacteroidetes bacterium]|nr:polysaccharide biosynthesis protein [Bacteroidota bacterium]
MTLRVTLKFALDFVLWGLLATPLAYMLRLDALTPQATTGILVMMGVLLPLRALLIYLAALPLRSWRKTGMRDLAVLAFVIAFVSLFSLALLVFLPSSVFVPRSIPFLQAMVAMLLMGGVRMAVRLFSEQQRRLTAGKGSTRRVLIAGAGEAGTMMARELLRHPEAKMMPVGFLDDDPSKRRLSFGGLPVLGALADLPAIAQRHSVDELLIAIPSASGDVIRPLVEAAREAEVEHRIIPGIYDLLSGNVSISEIREVNLEDLLRRDPVKLETGEIAAYLADRCVLVTGAGGSIGSEIVRQVTRFGPAKIVLVGRGENSIFQIEQEMLREFASVPIVPVICDVRDAEKLAEVFATHRPEVVFHAAAHKHVPLMEANPDQAIFNNVGGTRNVAKLCLEFNVMYLVNVSTDKAVNPTSVMGASKRVAEQVVQLAAQQAQPHQTFVSVRFGNVLGSRGSVVPFFQQQIARGGPVTVTHPEMIRYFMTIPEAAQLVLQAGGMKLNGAVFVLDMGKPVKIVDLARDLILLSGKQPDREIAITFTGMRPGEKLYEELLTAEEGTDASRHEKIFVARKSMIDEAWHGAGLSSLFDAASNRDADAVREGLAALIPFHKLKAASATQDAEA